MYLTNTMAALGVIYAKLIVPLTHVHNSIVQLMYMTVTVIYVNNTMYVPSYAHMARRIVLLQVKKLSMKAVTRKSLTFHGKFVLKLERTLKSTKRI